MKTEIILFYVLARQAVKTPPRRLPTVMVRSPIDSASPGGDYPLADLNATTMEEAASGVSFVTFPAVILSTLDKFSHF